jgi:hypothetical protein
MGESSAIRMGCGVADVSALQFQQMEYMMQQFSQQLGLAFLCLCCVAMGIKACAKELRPPMWIGFRRTVVTWAYLGPLLCTAAAPVLSGSYLNGVLLALWLLSAVFTAPYTLYCACRWLWALPALLAATGKHASLEDIKIARASSLNGRDPVKLDATSSGNLEDDQLYVAVSSSELSLRQGDYVVTRKLSNAEENGPVSGDDEATADQQTAHGTERDAAELCKA